MGGVLNQPGPERHRYQLTMKRHLIMLAVITGFLALATVQAAPAAPEKTVVITANDTLRFSVTKIEASPGELLHVQLHNEGTMPIQAMGHNWVLLQAGKDPLDFAAAAVSASDQGYIPAALKSEVIAHIGLLGPGQTGDVTFKAPTVPGKYPFLCTFPAHCAAGMRGVLIVK